MPSLSVYSLCVLSLVGALMAGCLPQTTRSNGLDSAPLNHLEHQQAQRAVKRLSDPELTADAWLTQADAIDTQHLTGIDAATITQVRHNAQLSLSAKESDVFRQRLNPLNNVYIDFIQDLLQHPVASAQDAHDYLEKLSQLPTISQQWHDQLTSAQQQGIQSNASDYQQAAQQLTTWLQQAPFNKQSAHSFVLWQDFQTKVAALDLYPSSKAVLTRKARRLLTRRIKKALLPSAKQLQTMANKAPDWQSLQDTDIGQAYRHWYLTSLYYPQHPGAVFQTLSRSLDEKKRQLIQQAQPFGLQLSPEALSQLSAATLDSALPVAVWAEFLQWFKTYQHRDIQAQNTATLVEQAIAQQSDLAKQLTFEFTQLPSQPLIIQATDGQKDALTQQLPTAIHYQSVTGQAVVTLAPSFAQYPNSQQRLLLSEFGIPGQHLAAHQTAIDSRLQRWSSDLSQQDWQLGWSYFAQAEFFEQTNSNELALHWLQLQRIAKAVVDAGVHAQGWSRQQAMDFLTAQWAIAPNDLERTLNQIQWQPLSHLRGFNTLKSLQQLTHNQPQTDKERAALRTYLLQLGPVTPVVRQQAVALKRATF